MCLLWRSPITWSPEFTSGDFIFNWAIAGPGMLEIGARQLNNWRLHEPPTSFPSVNLAPCQHAYTVAWCHVITSDYQGGTVIITIGYMSFCFELQSSKLCKISSHMLGTTIVQVPLIFLAANLQNRIKMIQMVPFSVIGSNTD